MASLTTTDRNEANSGLRDAGAAEKYGPKSTLAQSLATLAQSFLFIGLGMNLTIPAIVIRDLYKVTNNEFSLTMTEASWYGSVLFIIYPIGSFTSGVLQGKYGKKRCMIFANVPSLAGLLLLHFAQCPISLCTSSILIGFSTGFGAGSTSSYVGEITEPRLRGTLGSLGSTAARIGTMMVFIMGLFFDWRTVALLSTSCPVICLCFVVAIPESPIWLVAKGKTEKAEEALCWLRGWVDPETVKHEFLDLVRYNEVSGFRGAKTDTNAGDENFLSKLAQFKDPSVYRPLKLMMIFFFIAYISSIFHTRPFITKIMSEVDIVNYQNESLIFLSALTIVGSIISTATVHRVGKRMLTIWTLSINSVLLFLFGTYVVVVKNLYIESLPWIALTILCSIYFVGACGVSIIPWMLLIEVFPNKSREIATGVCTGLAYIILFALSKSYLPIETFLSLEYTMILFGCISAFGLIYVYYNLPETENKTLLEIEEFFASN